MPRPTAKAPARKPVKKYAASKAVPRVRGQGDYTYDKPGPWGRIGRVIGRSAGGMIGSQYGMGKPASAIGEKLGSYMHYIGKIFGSGDYVTASAGVKANNLVGAGSQAPQFDGSTSVRIRHREYLGDVISSSTAGAFQIQSYAINPGLTASFPWLANVCGATFQQYRLNGMVFEFRSMSANALNSTNTALGTVVMCTDYDSVDTPFTSKQQMENTMFGVSCKPSSNMIHAIECARYQTAVSELYVRAFGIPTNSDLRLYDMGKFSLATTGCQGTNVNLGELWVSYDVTLMKAIEQVPLYIAPFSSYTMTGVTSALPFGVQTTVIDQIGIQLLNFSSQGYIFFPVSIDVGSVWEIYYYVQGSSTALVSSPGFTVAGGMSSLTQVVNIPDGAPATSSRIQYVNKFKYLGGGTVATPPQIILGAITTFPASITLASIKLFQVSGTFASTPALSSSPTDMKFNDSIPITRKRCEVVQQCTDVEDDDIPDYIEVEERKTPIRELSRLRLKV